MTAAAALPGNVSRTPERGGQGRGLCGEMVLRAHTSSHAVYFWLFSIRGDDSLATD